MISTRQKEALQGAYRDACNNYLQAFVEKHGFDMCDTAWVADEPGTIAMIADYYVSMEEMKVDIDLNVPNDKYLEWYDYQMECAALELPKIANYKHYVKGCPTYSKETLKRLRGLKQEVEVSKKVLAMAIRDAELDERFN